MEVVSYAGKSIQNIKGATGVIKLAHSFQFKSSPSACLWMPPSMVLVPYWRNHYQMAPSDPLDTFPVHSTLLSKITTRKGRAHLRIWSQIILLLSFQSFFSTDYGPQAVARAAQRVQVEASARVRRWSYLSQFEYHLTFRRTTADANADAPQRFPLQVQPEIEQPPSEMVFLCQHLDDSPITAKHIQEKTSKDHRVEQFVLQGWPDLISALRPFFEQKLKLSVYQGCILWGPHVVIPEDYCEHVLH